MQNIADFMTDSRDEPMQPHDPDCYKLSTFLVYNERRKVGVLADCMCALLLLLTHSRAQ